MIKNDKYVLMSSLQRGGKNLVEISSAYDFGGGLTYFSPLTSGIPLRFQVVALKILTNVYDGPGPNSRKVISSGDTIYMHKARQSYFGDASTTTDLYFIRNALSDIVSSFPIVISSQNTMQVFTGVNFNLTNLNYSIVNQDVNNGMFDYMPIDTVDFKLSFINDSVPSALEFETEISVNDINTKNNIATINKRAIYSIYNSQTGEEVISLSGILRNIDINYDNLTAKMSVDIKTYTSDLSLAETIQNSGFVYNFDTPFLPSVRLRSVPIKTQDGLLTESQVRNQVLKWSDTPLYLSRKHNLEYIFGFRYMSDIAFGQMSKQTKKISMDLSDNICSNVTLDNDSSGKNVSFKVVAVNSSKPNGGLNTFHEIYVYSFVYNGSINDEFSFTNVYAYPISSEYHQISEYFFQFIVADELIKVDDIMTEGEWNTHAGTTSSQVANDAKLLAYDYFRDYVSTFKVSFDIPTYVYEEYTELNAGSLVTWHYNGTIGTGNVSQIDVGSLVTTVTIGSTKTTFTDQKRIDNTTSPTKYQFG